MTGRDRTDALVEALRQPALPTEQVGEAAAIASMVGTLTGAAAPRGIRSRKGAAIVAITAASLGVGGLAAAGPGVFPRVLDFGRAALPDQVQPDIASESAPPAVSLPDAVTSNPAMPPAPRVVPGGGQAAQPADPGVSPAVPADPRMAGPPEREGGEDDDVTIATSCVVDEHDDVVVEAAQTAEEDTDPVSEVARPDCGNAVDAGPPGSTPGNDDPGAPAGAGGPNAIQPTGGPDPSTGTKSPTTPVEQPPSHEPGGPDATPPAPNPPAPAPPAPPTPGNPSAPASPAATPPAPAAPGVPADPGAPDRLGSSTEHRASAGPTTSVASASGSSADASADLGDPGPGAGRRTP